MSELDPTVDLALSYQHIPRVNEQFVVQPDSYVDIMLPDSSNTRTRLRLHDINDRWIRAIDLSSYYNVPTGDALLNAPHGVFDTFALEEEFFIGRGDNNPNNLPILDKKIVSRNHLGITLRIGDCGLILAMKDLGSYNGTEIVMNDTLTRYTEEAVDLAA